MQVEEEGKENENEERWRCGQRRDEECSAAQHWGERRGKESRRAHKRSSLTGSDLDLRLHAHHCLQDENRENGRESVREKEGEEERERDKGENQLKSNKTDEQDEIETMEIGGGAMQEKEVGSVHGGEQKRKEK